jgi:hypothetical protein
MDEPTRRTRRARRARRARRTARKREARLDSGTALASMTLFSS